MMNCNGRGRKRSCSNITTIQAFGATEKNHEKPKLQQAASVPGFELGISLIGSGKFLSLYVSSLFQIYFFCSLHSWTHADMHSPPSECTNRTTRHRRTNINIHEISGIRTHALNIQEPVLLLIHLIRQTGNYVSANIFSVVRLATIVMFICCRH